MASIQNSRAWVSTDLLGLRRENAATLLALASAEAGLSPTRWQKSTFPADFQHKISVIHEGVDSDFFAPDPHASVALPDGRMVTAEDEILTYSARNMEPIRGFHSFMRTLPHVLEKRPGARVLIVGEDGVSYGLPPRKQPTWKAALLAELGDRIDPQRVHFLGRLPYTDYLKVLQVSTAHVYLTYPFVLSWSLLEAMSAGCLVVASDTAPVREIVNGSNGLLAAIFDIDALADKIVSALAQREAHQPQREAARRLMRESYDFTRVCAPRLIELIERLAGEKIILARKDECSAS